MDKKQRIWQHAQDLFYYGRIGKTLKDELKHSDIRLAAMIIVASGILMVLISVGSIIEQLYLVNYASDVAAEVLSIESPVIGWEQLAPYALFQLVFNLPFMVLFFFVYEAFVYQVMRLTGGEGTFSQQLHLSALVVLSVTIMSSIVLLTPLPCINAIAAIALIVLTVYFLLFVNVKVYEIVHNVSFLHSLTVVILLLVPRFWVLLLVTNAAAAIFGLPQQLDISGVEYGI